MYHYCCNFINSSDYGIINTGHLPFTSCCSPLCHRWKLKARVIRLLIQHLLIFHFVTRHSSNGEWIGIGGCWHSKGAVLILENFRLWQWLLNLCNNPLVSCQKCGFSDYLWRFGFCGSGGGIYILISRSSCLHCRWSTTIWLNVDLLSYIGQLYSLSPLSSPSHLFYSNEGKIWRDLAYTNIYFCIRAFCCKQ